MLWIALIQSSISVIPVANGFSDCSSLRLGSWGKNVCLTRYGVALINEAISIKVDFHPGLFSVVNFIGYVACLP
jgi:hypothetical protein